MVASMDISERDELIRFIMQRVGVQLNENQIKELERAVLRLLPSYRNLLHFLAVLTRESWDTPVWRELLQIITIGETYFFRNQDQFNALRSDVLPALIEKRRKQGFRQLRLWSAGCASGEEIYSLAILLRELIPDIASWNIYLLGTDINSTSLDRARRGNYRAWSFRNETPDYLQDRWFNQSDDTYTVHQSIRSMVNFELLNLVSDEYPSVERGTSNFDLIMFRNVSIYFDNPTTESIIKRFQSALMEGGWLVVGHAEPLAAGFQGFRLHNFPNAVLYQKSPVLIQNEMPVIPPMQPIVVPRKINPPAQPPRPVSKSPCPAPTNWQQAKSAADEENWEDALKWLSAAERENKFKAEIHHLRAVIQMQSNDMDGAIASLRRAIYCDSGFAMAYYTLGEVYLRRKAYKDAAHNWQLAQKSVAHLDSSTHVPFSDEITVEMFLKLLDHCLNTLLVGGSEGSNVDI